MKAKFNKSKIMKLAHHMMKHEGFSKSDALFLAWSKARRDDFYLIIEVRKTKRLSREEQNALIYKNATRESIYPNTRRSNYYGD